MASQLEIVVQELRGEVTLDELEVRPDNLNPMGFLVEEVRLWNTPLVGAYLLWMFTKGYCNRHPEGDAPIGLLHFIASAILTSSKLAEPISNRRDSLQSYARGFEQDLKTDSLLGIHDRVIARRGYTLAAIDVAISAGLLIWDTSSGKIYPREQATTSNGRQKRPRAALARDGKKAEILGNWFSQHDLQTIAAYLKVVF